MKNPFEVIHESWRPLFTEFYKEEFLYFQHEIIPNISYYPEAINIFRVFSAPVSSIKVVILGQDPYHGIGQANGLAFAVKENIPVPPSLSIINIELMNEFNDRQSDALNKQWKTLEHWQEQGVFLLNTALTVEAGKPGSHLKYWESFIRKVVYFIGFQRPCIWLLWGKSAQSYMVNLPVKTVFEVRGYDEKTIQQIPANEDYNYVLKAAHPAAEVYTTKGAGFYGCNHFKYTNIILSKTNRKIINW